MWGLGSPISFFIESFVFSFYFESCIITRSKECDSMKDITETMTFTTEEIRRENIKGILREVSEALEERGYNSVNQLSLIHI